MFRREYSRRIHFSITDGDSLNVIQLDFKSNGIREWHFSLRMENSALRFFLERFFTFTKLHRNSLLLKHSRTVSQSPRIHENGWKKPFDLFRQKKRRSIEFLLQVLMRVFRTDIRLEIVTNAVIIHKNVEKNTNLMIYL